MDLPDRDQQARRPLMSWDPEWQYTGTADTHANRFESEGTRIEDIDPRLRDFPTVQQPHFVSQLHDDGGQTQQPPTPSSSREYTQSVAESSMAETALTPITTQTSNSSQHSPRFAYHRTPNGFFCDYRDVKQKDCRLKYKLWDSLADLNHHQISHRPYEERPCACDEEECGKRFCYPKDVKRHKRDVHHASEQGHAEVGSTAGADERPHRCLSCFSTYKRRDALLRHVRTRNGDEKTLSCLPTVPTPRQAATRSFFDTEILPSTPLTERNDTASSKRSANSASVNSSASGSCTHDRRQSQYTDHPPDTPTHRPHPRRTRF